MKAMWLFALMLIAPLAQAQVLTDPAQEQHAVRLGNEIRCTTCQSASIEDSAAPMAQDLRQLVREKIAAGWSDAQIVDYLRMRYGDFILLRPPVQANTYALWLAPGLILAAGLIGLVVLIGRRPALKRKGRA